MSIINYDFSTFVNVFAKIKENGLATPTDLRTPSTSSPPPPTISARR